MLRFCTRCRGAISVFLTLILVPTFIFGGVLVDGSRILGAKNLISGAGDMALNAALSDYNEELNKTYGLLARASTADEVEDIMQDFFEATLNANGVSKEDFTKALVYLELTNDDFTASDIPGTEIYQTEVLKQEILEYMKYRAPVTLVNRAIDNKVEELKNMEKEKNAADGQIKFESKLDGVQNIMDKIKECTDSLETDYANTLDEAGMDSLLEESMNAYRDRITVLAVAYHRMQNCHERKEENADTQSLMKEMISLSCDVSKIDAATASNIIKMIIVKNSMAGRSVDELLVGLNPNSSEYQKMQELIADYEEADAVRAEGISNTKKQLEEEVENVYNRLYTQRKYVFDGKDMSEDVIKLIGDLRDKLDKLEASYREWESAVAELPAGTSREAYEESLEEYAGFFDENSGTLGEFENKIEKSVTFYSEMLEKLDDVTFMDKTLDVDIKSYNDFFDGVDSGEVKEAAEITAKAGELMERYHDTALRVSVAKSEIDFREDAFFKKLKYEYCNKDGNKEKSEKEAEKQNKSLESTLDELKTLLLTDDIENLDMSQWELPSNWLGYRQYSADSEDGQENGLDIQVDIEDDKSREQFADSESGSLNKDNDSIHGMSGLADKLSEVGENVAEPLFLTEYVIGMFSHYTSNWEDGSEVESPLSLSRSELKNDIAYRAEVEYILWGSPNTATNVRITKAIVFTVNFIFNMSFAFTDGTMRAQALEISAAFPVGALAKFAIRCALKSMAAMMETTKNMMKLMKGEAVALIKKDTVWHTWLTNPLESEENEKYTGMVKFTYEDYLWILVCIKMFTGEQAQLLARTADCIELNMTDKKTDDDNSMKEMYTMIDLETSVSIDTFFIQRLSGAGYNTGTTGDDMFKVKYYGIQGY